MGGSSELTSIKTITLKEISDDLRSRRFLLAGVFYLVVSLIMAIVIWYAYGNATTIFRGNSPTDSVFILMGIFNFLLVILAIMISSDSISLEKRERTIYQTLSKPVERSSIILGKFLGSMITISVLFFFSSAVAYALTAISTGVYPGFGHIIGASLASLSMIMVLAVYVALGMLISVIVKNPIVAIVSSIIIWLAFSAISFIGSVLGIISSISTTGSNITTDPFKQYPIYAKLMIWISPSSHSIMSQFIGINPPSTVSGFPMWANVIFLLVYALILLSIAVVIFKKQDL